MPSANTITDAHAAYGTYKAALDDCERCATALATAALNAGVAAKALAPLVTTPLAAITWAGAPPVSTWKAALPTLRSEFKAALKA